MNTTSSKTSKTYILFIKGAASWAVHTHTDKFGNYIYYPLTLGMDE